MSGKDFEPIGRRKNTSTKKSSLIHAAAVMTMIMMKNYLMTMILMSKTSMMKRTS